MSDDDAFRAEVRAFIAENLPEEISRRTLLFYHPHKPDVLDWTAKLNARGWSVPGWPTEYGGPGWTIAQRHIFEEECFAAGCPALSPQGVFLVGPIIYTYGTEAQKAKFLPPIRSGAHFWAQGFSEPNAGSDLASLQTRAERDGDHYVVNGQKIWTSEAQYSEWLFLLVRTGFTGKPQAGISFLLVDLKTPGITVRPIVSIDGGHILNEVFFTDVRVPVENLVGEENKGWDYGKELLANERTFSAEVPRCKGLLARLKRIAEGTLVRGVPLSEDPHFARRIAQLEIEVLAHETTLWRVVAQEAAEVASDAPTSSILKVRGTELIQRIGALTVEALGDDALPAYPETDYLLGAPDDPPGTPLAPGVTADFFYRRAITIYGGSNEIQRNIIASELLRG
ncbi:acyl-CoA dehydrogenase family protein [Sphingosinicella sp. LHD-64]|uniref:acyl-CoA dehydrogenase family protein n=1 Tax=Sphingosinicella sp. LHD-64 TaxID=3072139 RepID=UPI00280F72F4|nr:acyl-CoA dehydrogenase family protein [Sphingosinicella sp. LHD-64]MDQ8757597.1 acyl-CoA dehydrogenase family protein [Sphingosinicella sp. LHD-64]